MPTKAQENAEEQKNARVIEEPTRQDIFEAALVVARYTNRVPTLLGPTASGKTYMFEHQAEAHNAEVITVLLGQHTPDEISGFQLALNDKLVIQMPYWFTEAQRVLDSGKSAWIFFDELGLAREETRGALYTFMRDRHLHGHKLQVRKPDSEVLVFAASNPATFAPPFRSRCLFLSVPSDRTYLSSIAEGSAFVSKIVKLAPIEMSSDPFYSNEPPPQPVVIDASAAKALMDLTKNSNFWKLSEPARYAILQGLVPHQTLVAALADSTLDVTALALDIVELGRALRVLPTDKKLSMISNVISVLPQIDKNARVDALLTILDVIYEDTSGQLLQTYFSTANPVEAVQAVSEIDVQYLEDQLQARNLFWIETRGKTNNVRGKFLENAEKMVAYQQQNPTP